MNDFSMFPFYLTQFQIQRIHAPISEKTVSCIPNKTSVSDIMTAEKTMEKKSRSDTTKYRLAEAVKECMKTTPVEEITVKQIAAVCGTTRQTFYRNFRDRDDLINWYFNIILDESFRQLGSGETVFDGLIRKFEYIHKEHLFFSAAFRTDTQNNLKDHDFRMIYDFYRNLIREKTGSWPDPETEALLEMYCQSSVYMTVKWVLSGMQASEKDLAKLMIDAMPAKIRSLFTQLDIV